VKHVELQQLLTEFAAERLALLQRHEAGARTVSHYDFNNTYQYVINREETHLEWLQNALADFATPLPGPSQALSLPDVLKTGKKIAAGAFKDILEDDASTLAKFVERWRPRVAEMTHARHRNMLGVIFGESLEHKRLFDQAASGFEDLLGRRTGGVPRQGAVLPTRWME
jgi:uncharacterized protein (DUF1501 family)